MKKFRIGRKFGSTVFVDAAVTWLWRHRDEVGTWARSVPNMLQRARAGEGMKAWRETKSVAAQARSIDRQRRVNQGNRSRLLDSVATLRRRSKRTPDQTVVSVGNTDIT